MTKEKLTRQQTAAMRGIAILAIVLHNFAHWLRPMVKENEYTFTAHNADRLMTELLHPSSALLAHLLSFFGHYGVPVFIFLSAYGLVMKYESGTAAAAAPAPPSPSGGILQDIKPAADFIMRHCRKLFCMMVVGYAAFVMTDYMTPRPHHYEFWNIVGQLGMFSNLYADPDHAIWPGPYWYFGLMVQIYIFYRLFLYNGDSPLTGRKSFLFSQFTTFAVLAATLFAQYLFSPEGDALTWYRYNLFGSLPVFTFALLWTRAKTSATEAPRRRNLVIFLVSSLLTVVMSLWFATWIFVPFAVCLATVSLVRVLPAVVLKALEWVGGISAAMFVCHPITRKVLIPIAHSGDIYAGLLLYLVATVMLSLLFRRLIAGVTR